MLYIERENMYIYIYIYIGLPSLEAPALQPPSQRGAFLPAVFAVTGGGWPCGLIIGVRRESGVAESRETR